MAMTNNYTEGKKNSFKKRIINYLVILFFIHGFLFFLRPQEIYDLDSPIRYIKYIVFMMILFIVLKESNYKKIFMYLLVATTIFATNIMAVGNSFSPMSFISYVLPLSTFFFYNGLRKNLDVKKIAFWTYVMATLFAYYEYFILGGIFSRFASSGYRVVSIFVNPNNFALMITILSVYIISHKISKINMLGLLINSLLLIVLSGSKTGLFIYILVISLNVIINIIKLFTNKTKIKKSNILYILVIGISLNCVSVFVVLFGDNHLNALLNQTRSLETILISLDSRFIQYNTFFSQSSFMFPWKDTVNYTDNIYLHIWGSFGLPTIISFVLFNIFLVYKSIKKKGFVYFGLLLISLIAGLTTNILYLWPIGYIYWYVAGSILSRNEH